MASNRRSKSARGSQKRVNSAKASRVREAASKAATLGPNVPPQLCADVSLRCVVSRQVGAYWRLLMPSRRACLRFAVRCAAGLSVAKTIFEDGPPVYSVIAGVFVDRVA